MCWGLGDLGRKYRLARRFPPSPCLPVSILKVTPLNATWYNAERKVTYLGSRGLARASIGERKGAIADFQAYIDFPDKPEEYKTQRKQWIESLEKGEDPFTDKVLEELKK